MNFLMWQPFVIYRFYCVWKNIYKCKRDLLQNLLDLGNSMNRYLFLLSVQNVMLDIPRKMKKNSTSRSVLLELSISGDFIVRWQQCRWWATYLIYISTGIKSGFICWRPSLNLLRVCYICQFSWIPIGVDWNRFYKIYRNPLFTQSHYHWNEAWL